MMRGWSLILLLALCACAPDRVGERVGETLYNASVNTGRALAVAGDRTGQAIQNAGTNLRSAVNPPPRYAPPLTAPEGFVPAPITTEPLGTGSFDPYRDEPRDTAPNPAVGY